MSQSRTPSDVEVADVATSLAALAAQIVALQARVAALEAAGAAPAEAKPIEAAVAVAAPAEPPAAAPAPARIVDHDPLGGVHTVLRALFELALEPEADDPEAADAQFFRFLDLVHSERKGSPMLEMGLRQYAYRQLRKNATIYLRDADDPATYDVTRMVPAEVVDKTDAVKVFVRAATRMPTPISLRRDGNAQRAWRIESSSL